MRTTLGVRTCATLSTNPTEIIMYAKNTLNCVRFVNGYQHHGFAAFFFLRPISVCWGGGGGGATWYL